MCAEDDAMVFVMMNGRCGLVVDENFSLHAEFVFIHSIYIHSSKNEKEPVYNKSDEIS